MTLLALGLWSVEAGVELDAIFTLFGDVFLDNGPSRQPRKAIVWVQESMF